MKRQSQRQLVLVCNKALDVMRIQQQCTSHSSYFMCSCSRLRHKALNSQGNNFYDALGFPAQSLVSC